MTGTLSSAFPLTGLKKSRPRIGGLALALALSACGGGGGEGGGTNSDVANKPGDPNGPTVKCAPKVISGFNGDLNNPGGGGGSDGSGAGAGAGAAGDGAGDGGGVGLGKSINALFTVARLSDGQVLGEAATDARDGTVTIFSCDEPGPFLVTVRGQAGARYFDESLNAFTDFGPDKVLHALVQRFDEHVGVSPLTEAAYRYALNNFKLDPVKVAAGTTPLGVTGDLTGLTADKVEQANSTVLRELNRMLPSGLQLSSLVSLPTPIDQTSADNSLRTNKYGLIAAVIGGLVKAGGQFQGSTPQPALALTDQLARDLTDGILNGRALDGSSTAQANRVYDPTRLPVAASVGTSAVTQRFASTTIFPLTPGINEYAIGSVPVYTFNPSNPVALDSQCLGQFDEAALLRNGTVSVIRRAGATASSCIPGTAIPILIRDFDTSATNGKAIQVVGSWNQAFVVRENGTLGAWGLANCGRLGNGQIQGRFDRPTSVAGISGVRAIANGLDFTLALTNAGTVFAWGSPFSPQVMGLGFDDPLQSGFDVAACDPYRGVAPSPNGIGAITRPRRISSLTDIVSITTDSSAAFAVNSAGRIYMWGNGTYPSGSGGVSKSTPNLLPDMGRVRSVTVASSSGPGETVAFALRADGSVMAWGSNRAGNLGDGTSTARLTPIVLPTLSDVREIVALNTVEGPNLYRGALLALRGDGTVFAWGGPLFGSTIRPLSQIVGTSAIPGKIRHLWASNREFVLFAEDGKLYRIADGSTVVQELPAGGFQ